MTSPRTGHAFLDAVLDQPGTVLAFAHRGGAHHPEIVGLENTLTAFRHASSLGYGYLETDVHATADGHLIAFHDAVLDRVSDGHGAIAELTAEQVAAVRIGGREQVPTLAQLFDTFPSAHFNIDLKSEAAVPLLADFVARRRAEDRVLVGSFSGRRLREFRRLTAGRVPTSASPGEIVAFSCLPGRVADRLTRGRVAALQIPHRRKGVLIASRALIRRAHAAGKQVHVWTIDDPTEMNLLLDRGVDALMTDRTDILKAVLVQRGQWREET